MSSAVSIARFCWLINCALISKWMLLSIVSCVTTGLELSIHLDYAGCFFFGGGEGGCIFLCLQYYNNSNKKCLSVVSGVTTGPELSIHLDYPGVFSGVFVFLHFVFFISFFFVCNITTTATKSVSVCFCLQPQVTCRSLLLILHRGQQRCWLNGARALGQK